MIAIAAERPAQREAVLALNRATFGGEDQVHILERLSQAGLVTASLVATEGAASRLGVHFPRVVAP